MTAIFAVSKASIYRQSHDTLVMAGLGLVLNNSPGLYSLLLHIGFAYIKYYSGNYLAK